MEPKVQPKPFDKKIKPMTWFVSIQFDSIKALKKRRYSESDKLYAEIDIRVETD